jgi:CheY-like chemotaxis protein
MASPSFRNRMMRLPTFVIFYHPLSMVIELRWLRSFLAVADEMHFSRAARKLHLAQPALTSQIQQLERGLGTSLFQRSNRITGLTADYFDPIKQDKGSPIPLSLVILDLNLPGRNGIEVLTQIRAKFDSKKVPVVLFSASDQQSDIESCYAAGCNGYVVKPSNPEQLNTLVLRLADYWLKENRYSKSIPGVA